jgi:Ca-activated chloride channel family protein
MAREVLREFIKKRPSDRIGIVAFAGRPYLAAPLTLDHDFLLQNLERLRLGAVREYNSTAIGSALATAVNRLEHVSSKSRIVILMTDGQNNAGKVPPLAAAEAAKALGIKVYTIGIGRQGQSYVLRQFMGRLIREPVLVDIDEDTLQKIAELTGGKYYRADNTERFRQIYEEIDRLEKTEPCWGLRWCWSTRGGGSCHEICRTPMAVVAAPGSRRALALVAHGPASSRPAGAVHSPPPA